MDHHSGRVAPEPEVLTRAAAAALSPVLGTVEVTVGERLDSSDRAVVMRAIARDAHQRDHPVVLKAPLGSAGGSGVREEAALRLLAGHRVRHVVRLLGAAVDPPLLVLADLGNRPTLADRLLGDDPVAAEAAVLTWAGAVGTVQSSTTGLRAALAAEFAALSPLGPLVIDTSAEAVSEAAAVLARFLPQLGITPHRAALDELRGIAEDLDVAAPGAPGGIVPGDTCPSNAVETGDGLVLLDFEGAEFRHVAWEAAYLCVPWPSCWCSWRLPEELAARALARWREVVAATLPVVATSRFDDDLVRAATAWVFISVGWFLGPALDGDPPPPDPARRSLVPARRALLQHRLQWVATQQTPLLPALRDLAAHLHQAAVRRWGEHPLPLAAAFDWRSETTRGT